MFPIVEPDVEVPPVVDERHQVGHEVAGRELLGGEAAPTPLVFELVVDVLRVGALAVEARDRHGGECHRIERGHQDGDAA